MSYLWKIDELYERSFMSYLWGNIWARVHIRCVYEEFHYINIRIVFDHHVHISWAYIHTYIATTCIHTYTHTHIHTYIHTYIHTHIHTHIHSYIHTFVHTYIRTYIHVFMHAYIHTYIHIHTWALRTIP